MNDDDCHIDYSFDDGIAPTSEREETKSNTYIASLAMLGTIHGEEIWFVMLQSCERRVVIDWLVANWIGCLGQSEAMG